MYFKDENPQSDEIDFNIEDLSAGANLDTNQDDVNLIFKLIKDKKRINSSLFEIGNRLG